ncbi:MAG: hydroxymethylpyrimidine/phosphomethylpyrimidine kinase [Candidatus Aminicenantes bacterium]|nr:hydroxymethylpyrimidine/phosphomethylpyrimidine kinase [Candidatus Aminicenantes bacterium]
MTRTLLTIAGFDPSGGAGALSDTAVFRFLGFHGAAILTAVTAQGPSGVRAVQALPPKFILAQHRALVRDIDLAGLKVGMAATAENLAAVGRILGRHPGIPRVVDPVLRSSSGARLLEKAAAAGWLAAVRRRASVLTPNLSEASRLAGRAVDSVEAMSEAAGLLFDRTEVPCLITGGHLSGPAVNVLYDGRRLYRFERKKLPGDVHGTGCFFSAALLGFLALGRSLPRAAALATDLTYLGIRAAVRLGRGRPVIPGFRSPA